MDLIIPGFAGLADRIGALSTTRRGGFSRGPYAAAAGSGGLNLGTHVGDVPDDVARNRELLNRILPSEPAWLNQVHGVRVVNAADVHGAPEADASVATRPGVVCLVQTADCLPVLLCDANGKAVGAAHAGWRGLVAGVIENTVARMKDEGATDIHAWLGPAIGPAHFEVGEEVRAAFIARSADNAQAFRPIIEHAGKYLADIYALARKALSTSGVKHITGGEHCTVADRERFYSYRRDRTTGRMASLIWLK